jgi:hypothetical protein
MKWPITNYPDLPAEQTHDVEERGECHRALRGVQAPEKRACNTIVGTRPTVAHLHFPDKTGHFGAEGREIAPNVRIVGDLFESSSLPRAPVARDGDNDGQGQPDHQRGSAVLPPHSLQPWERVRRAPMRRERRELWPYLNVLRERLRDLNLGE